jgi:4-hydroxy-3-polyprenylbenzoate decarboxylase
MRRLIIGISGASGVIMGYALLKALRAQTGIEIHLVITESAALTFGYETDLSLDQVYSLADFVYANHNMGAIIASGTFVTEGMIVIPCSMKTLSAATTAYSDTLLARTMDVCLKENRRVVLVPREMPLNRVHLRNMQLAADYGYIIIPPMLTFYNEADTVGKQIDHVVGKVLMQFGIIPEFFVPWYGSN